MLISSMISSIRSTFSFSSYTNRKRRASTCNPSGHPLDHIITPTKRMRIGQDEEVNYTEHVTHSKSSSSKVWFHSSYPPDIVLMDKLSSTLRESDPEVNTIDDDDEGEIIVDNVEKNVKPKKRPQADKHTGVRAKIPNKYNMSAKVGQHNMTGLSYDGVSAGYVGPPVYDAIFNDNVTRDASGRCSNALVSEAGSFTGFNRVSLHDKAVYRDCLNSLVYPNDSIGADSPWPRRLQPSYTNSRRMQSVTVDKMNDSGVYQQKTANKTPPVIDLTGLTENGEHLEIIGSKSSASDNEYTKKINGIDHQRKSASASLASTRGILKTSVPASQLAEETGSGSKPIVESRQKNLGRKLYESPYLQDNYFANMKMGFNVSDKVINQQEETSKPIVRSRQMKLDRTCKYYILGRLQPSEHGQGDLSA